MSAKYCLIVAVEAALLISGHASTFQSTETFLKSVKSPNMDDPLFEHMTNEQKQNVINSPIGKVIGMLQNLKDEVNVDGQKEKLSYNKYACWCENTIANKTTALNENREQIKQVRSLLEKTKGTAASAAVEVKHLQKDIQVNQASTAEAAEIRREEAVAFHTHQTETNSALQALDQAIQIIRSVMSTGFLEKKKHTQLMTVVGGIKSVLKMKIASHMVRDELEVVERFVEHPEEYLSQGRSKGLSALQTDPFASSSDQIGGILSEMKRAFQEDLERATEEEQVKEESYTALVNTKTQEMTSLEVSLQSATVQEAEESKVGAENQVLLADLSTKISNDEKLIADVTVGCKQKAEQWTLRSAARSEELLGINEALHYLGSSKSLETFEKVHASSMLVQISDVTEPAATRSKAFKLLSSAAKGSQSTSLALIAANLKAGNHFDDIISQLNSNIAELEKENHEDEVHRDRCAKETAANKLEVERLTMDVNAAQREINRLASHATVLQGSITKSEAEIANSKELLAEMTTNREAEKVMLAEAIKQNEEAQGFIEGAMAMLAKFYGTPSLLQNATAPPPPSMLGPEGAETTFQSAAGDRHEAGSAVVEVLGLINKDISKDLQEQRTEEAEAEQTYRENSQALRASIEAEFVAMNLVREELAEVQQKKAGEVYTKQQKDTDLADANQVKAALETDCAWVVPYFESRRTKRTAEIAGMNQAKQVLAAQ